MVNFNFEREKAIAALTYICNQLGGEWDKYSLLKILYFSEKVHLAKYGRPITGDRIVAYKYGPVPHCSYQIINDRTEVYFSQEEGNIIKALRPLELDYLSETDKECLDISISENKTLDFGRLKDKSHDAAYNKAYEQGEHTEISYLDIAECGGANPDMLEYIKYTSEISNSILHDSSHR